MLYYASYRFVGIPLKNIYIEDFANLKVLGQDMETRILVLVS